MIAVGLSEYRDKGIPERYLNASLQNPKPGQEKPLEHAKTLYTGQIPDKGLFIYGSGGTGKSHSLYCMAKSWVKGELERAGAKNLILHDFKVIKFRWLIHEFNRRTFHKSKGDEDIVDLIEELCRCRVLFIDEMTIRVDGYATESPYRWAYEAMNALVDTWWDSRTNGGLYITSNNTAQELAQAFSLPFMDRIRGMCEPIEMNGESLR